MTSNKPPQQLALPLGEQVGEVGPPCLACGGPTRITAGTGPHHARINCIHDPRHWRWLPRPRPARRTQYDVT